MKKRDYILSRLIEEYIKRPEPISSKRLRAVLDMDLSSATIRYYFKQLTQMGELEKTHVSSGRVPTESSLRQFWARRLPKEYEAEIDETERLTELAKRMQIFCEFYTLYDYELSAIERYKDFLICSFEGKEFVTRYNKNLERFLRNQIGRKAFDLAQNCYDIGLVAFAKSLKRFLFNHFELCEIEEVVRISQEDSVWAKSWLPRYIDGSALLEQKSGVQFHKGALHYKFRIKKPGEPLKGEMILLGKIHRDFEGFLHNMKGVDHE